LRKPRWRSRWQSAAAADEVIWLPCAVSRFRGIKPYVAIAGQSKLIAPVMGRPHSGALQFLAQAVGVVGPVGENRAGSMTRCNQVTSLRRYRAHTGRDQQDMRAADVVGQRADFGRLRAVDGVGQTLISWQYPYRRASEPMMCSRTGYTGHERTAVELAALFAVHAVPRASLPRCCRNSVSFSSAARSE
jgi:hypothetical protein